MSKNLTCGILVKEGISQVSVEKGNFLKFTRKKVALMSLPTNIVTNGIIKQKC